MRPKSQFKDINLDFKLATQDEICKELGRRLKNQRLVKNIKQQELADRAGIAVGTVKNLEAKGQCSLATLTRIAMALDLLQDLQQLFSIKIQSIAQMEKVQNLTASPIPRRAR